MENTKPSFRATNPVCDNTIGNKKPNSTRFRVATEITGGHAQPAVSALESERAADSFRRVCPNVDIVLSSAGDLAIIHGVFGVGGALETVVREMGERVVVSTARRFRPHGRFGITNHQVVCVSTRDLVEWSHADEPVEIVPFQEVAHEGHNLLGRCYRADRGEGWTQLDASGVDGNGDGRCCVQDHDWSPELVWYLKKYTPFMTRDRSLLVTLVARARTWKAEVHMMDECFSKIVAKSVVMAALVDDREANAMSILLSETGEAATQLCGPKFHPGRINDRMLAYRAHRWFADLWPFTREVPSGWTDQ